MRVAYLDCFSGLSGDMFLGALLDAGLEPADLEGALAKLPLEGCVLRYHRVHRGPLAAMRVEVEISGPQPARRRAEIFDLLEQSGLPHSVVAKSKAVFRRLVAAEAKVHGAAPEEVHLHEAGAADALIDVVGTVSGLERLGVEALWVSPLPCPRGWVASRHGPIPLPAPAVLELLTGVPLYGVEEEGELVTPTGAALAVALAAGFGPAPFMRLLRVGYGAGARELRHPNVLRLLVGEAAAAAGRATGEGPDRSPQPGAVAVLEASIDDMSGEFYPHLAERLRELGAYDVYWTAIQMKKGRPGVLLTALVPPALVDRAAQLLLAESTTLGLRWRLEHRLLAPRDWLTVQVGGREIRVKYSTWCLPGLERPAQQVAPEYEDCRRVARETGLPLKEVYFLAEQEARRRLAYPTPPP